ncbi:MAG: glycosyltransferase family 2 protein [Myxococcales bacterium]|jgi:glycosyltransferase involved in cell wall biosynthesis
MINHQKIAVILPAYNAEKTLEMTVERIDRSLIDDVIVVDDCSADRTPRVAERLAAALHVHDENLGYGGNQKSCYRIALARGADVVVMLHPDYQYDPRLLVAMAAPICYDVYDVMLGSRILGGTALSGGMPPLKYVVNRGLTFFQNLAFGRKLSEYHTGYRAFSSDVLQTLALSRNSNDFVFDSQMLAQAIAHDYRIGEVSCPTHYFPEASSIGLWRGVVYAGGCVAVALQYRAQRAGWMHFDYLETEGGLREPPRPPPATVSNRPPARSPYERG